ncbi:hypothetical protein J3Q64DRAFT_1746103, partial [Phycomyces blakesleeanus]
KKIFVLHIPTVIIAITITTVKLISFSFSFSPPEIKDYYFFKTKNKKSPPSHFFPTIEMTWTSLIFKKKKIKSNRIESNQMVLMYCFFVCFFFFTKHFNCSSFPLFIYLYLCLSISIF